MRWRAFTTECVTAKRSTSLARRKNSAPSNSARKSSACAAVSRARMKFPLRLSLDLLCGKVSGALVKGRDAPMIRHLSPTAFASDQKEIDAESDPEAAVMKIPASIVAQTTAPVLWVGGDEPLQHPVIGRISAALNQAGRNVFVHTNGSRLRQRIH